MLNIRLIGVFCFSNRVRKLSTADCVVLTGVKFDVDCRLSKRVSLARNNHVRRQKLTIVQKKILSGVGRVRLDGWETFSLKVGLLFVN